MQEFISILVLILAPVGMLVCLELQLGDDVAPPLSAIRSHKPSGR